MDEVKYLRKEYLKLPKQAFKCKLAGIEKPPGNALPTDVCAQFNDMVMDKEFNIRFVSIDSQSICEVSLVENNDRNVVTFDAAKVLIDSGMVQPLRMLNKGCYIINETFPCFSSLSRPFFHYFAQV